MILRLEDFSGLLALDYSDSKNEVSRVSLLPISVYSRLDFVSERSVYISIDLIHASKS